MAELQFNPKAEQALARLKCSHCQSLLNREELVQAVLTELQSRFPSVWPDNNDTHDALDSALRTAVKAGIERFFEALSKQAA